MSGELLGVGWVGWVWYAHVVEADGGWRAHRRCRDSAGRYFHSAYSSVIESDHDSSGKSPGGKVQIRERTVTDTRARDRKRADAV